MGDFFKGLQVEVTNSDIYGVLGKLISELIGYKNLKKTTETYLETPEGAEYYKYLLMKNKINDIERYKEERAERVTYRSVIFEKIGDMIEEEDLTIDYIIEVLMQFGVEEKVAEEYSQKIYTLNKIRASLEEGKKVYRNL